MQSAQVVTLTCGQQNRFRGRRKIANVLIDLRTSSTLPRCFRVTGNPEVESQKRDGQN